MENHIRNPLMTKNIGTPLKKYVACATVLSIGNCRCSSICPKMTCKAAIILIRLRQLLCCLLKGLSIHKTSMSIHVCSSNCHNLLFGICPPIIFIFNALLQGIALILNTHPSFLHMGSIQEIEVFRY